MRRLVFLSVTVAAAAPADGHWRYTRWGMSPVELQRANPDTRPGVEPRHSIEGSLVLMSAPHSNRGSRFVARFGFDGRDRLNTVYLGALNPRDCGRILTNLEHSLGRGEVDEATGETFERRTWHSDGRGNFVQFIRMGDGRRPAMCSVRYHPLSGPPEARSAPPSRASRPV